MEGDPTMLDIVFFKELKIIRKGSDRQGLLKLARLKKSSYSIILCFESQHWYDILLAVSVPSKYVNHHRSP